MAAGLQPGTESGMVSKTSKFVGTSILSLFALCGGVFAGQTDSVTTADESRSLFYQFVVAGGPIVWFALIPLSVLTVYLIAEMFITIRKSKLMPTGCGDLIIDLCSKFPIVQIPVRLQGRDDLLSRAVGRTIEKLQNAKSSVNVQEVGAEALYEQASPLLRRAEWCNMIGNVAPMVGLLGTVYGMIKAFNVLGLSAGQPAPDKLASAIGVALITTFWGLAIAIPALVVCGVFRNRIEGIAGEVAIELERVLGQISFKPRKRIEKKTTSSGKGRVEVISPDGVEIK